MQNLILQTKSKTILYIEDDDNVREETSLLFNEFFNIVIEAHDGLNGLDIYKEYYEQNNKYFDLIISDISMPNINGIEFIDKIYQINNKQKIIVISAFTDEKYLIPLLNLGINEFIKKPIVINDFINILKKISTKYWNNNILISDNCYFDGTQLIIDNRNISLTKNELLLLKQFINNKHKHITLSDIHYELYYNEPLKVFSEDSIRTLIKRLRKKLPANSIINNRTLGYILNNI